MSDAYMKCIESSEQVSWSISELIPENFKLDFSRNFLPQSLTFENKLSFLSAQEKLHLNHIRSASYMNIFGFVEEYITAFMVRLASESSFDENSRLRALLRFSEEEVKHQMMFNKYVQLFNNSFPIHCEFLSGADEVANIILSNSKLSVLFLTYHIEVMTQQHYLESVKDDSTLDEHFSFILKKHWQEESQHAKIDRYEIIRVAKELNHSEIADALNDYFNVLGAFSGLMQKQVWMDLDSLQKCSQRTLSSAQQDAFVRIQHYSYVYDFILYGLKNQMFQEGLKAILPDGINLLNRKIKSLERPDLERVDAT
jgi:hypothetical protein